MEIFLPAAEAARVKIGADSRITFDIPGLVVPGYVTFISPEAQFTPKQVETRSEREKLVFRVKIQIPMELVAPYIQSVKTGVRGLGYIKADASAVWPKWLQSTMTVLQQQSPATTVTPPAPSSPKGKAESKPSETMPTEHRVGRPRMGNVKDVVRESLIVPH